MTRLWAFIGQEGNRQVLGWLGGGAIVVIGGLWVGYTHFFPDTKPAGGRGPSVSATTGGVAIGGDVSGSNITVVTKGAANGAANALRKGE